MTVQGAKLSPVDIGALPVFGAEVARAADRPAFAAGLCGHLRDCRPAPDALNLCAAVAGAVVTLNPHCLVEHVTKYDTPCVSKSSTNYR